MKSRTLVDKNRKACDKSMDVDFHKDFKEADPKSTTSATDAQSRHGRLQRGEMVVHEVVVSMPSSLRGLT